MDENIIKEKLDQLAEFHAQKDSIDAQKRAMLDEVKVPAEIQQIVSDGMKRAASVENSQRPAIDALNAEVEAQLAKIIVPDEIKKALEEIDRQRKLIAMYQVAKLEDYRNSAAAKRAEIQAETEAQTAQVYADLAQRKRDIEAEFAGKLDAVDANIKALENEVKADTKAHGSTVKGKYFSTVYVKGRVTWNNDMLDGMIALVPQLASARKEGEPSITLRRI